MLDKTTKILFKVCTILSDNNIKYWICNGTLLGIIRDNSILPWDHDLDFGVFSYDVSKKKIRAILCNNNFIEEMISDDNDCLHFIFDQVKVDINIFSIKDEVVYCKWVVLNKGYFNRLKYFILGCNLSNKNIYPPKSYKSYIFYIFRFLKRLLILFRFPFFSFLKNILLSGTYTRTGYSYPLSYFNKFINYRFQNTFIIVPEKYNLILEHTYGKNWRIPNPSYVWHKDASNTI